jgi:uncharacterized protein
LNVITEPAFYALAVPAVLLTGLSKSGFSGIGTLSVPLLTLVVTAPQAVIIMLPLLLLADVLGLIGFRGSIDRAILKLAIPAGLVGILLGWLLFKYVNTNILKAVIGLEAIIFAVQKLLEGRSAWTGPGLPLNKPKAAFFSVLAGFASFLSHTGSPPMMQFMLPMKMDRMVMVGTLAWFFAFINFSKLLPYGQLGLIQITELTTSLLLLPCIPIGYWIGVRLIKKVSQAIFVRLISILLLLTGIKLVWDAFS